jgi:methylmalonyl-CoA mutase C-terminal domain/subunit
MMGKPLRVLVAKPGLDGHDRGALLLCRALRDAGVEVIFGGLFTPPKSVARIAADEDVAVVALSLLNGAHNVAFPKVLTELKKLGRGDITVVGGGIIPAEDKTRLQKLGILGNFGPGTPLTEIVEFIKKCGQSKNPS